MESREHVEAIVMKFELGKKKKKSLDMIGFEGIYSYLICWSSLGLNHL